MRQLVLWLCCLPLLALAQALPGDPPSPRQQGQEYFVSDARGYLKPDTVAALNRISQHIEQQTGAEFAVVLAPRYSRASAFDEALALFNTWGIGKRGADNGLLLYAAMDSRDWHFITGYGLEGLLPDTALARLGERTFVPEMRAGRVDAAFLNTARAIEGILLAPDAAAELQRLGLVEVSFMARHRTLLMQLALIAAVYVGLLAWLRVASVRFRRAHGEAARPRAALATLLGTLARGLKLVFFHAPMMLLAYVTVSGFAVLFAMLFAMLYDELGFGHGGDSFTALLLWVAPNRPAALCWHMAGWGATAFYTLFFLERGRVDALAQDAVQRHLLRHAWQQRVGWLMLASAWLWPMWWLSRRAERRWQRYASAPPDGPGPWEFLGRRGWPPQAPSPAQRAEQACGARVYMPWRHVPTGEVHWRAHPGRAARRFGTCPGCGAQTFPERTEVVTVQSPTRSSTGVGRRQRVCVHCTHTVALGTVVLPRLSSDSGGSSSGSGGGSSGGSSSGSFGGGSSGGGGAGGRW
ncbi:MAG: TPM domain-containing protein [Pseudomonadota bacterium]|nr:TPM domain-containing protein [Pseudomonadota bacterium]